MITSNIYRYPHPLKPDEWIYVGQTCNLIRRDRFHRLGKSSFGRRFRETFPSIELPEPVFREVSVENYITLNEEETIDIFKYHVWHGQGGMNLVLPGSLDYENIGRMTTRLGLGIHGRSKEQMSKDNRAAGLIGGRKQTDLKLGFHGMSKEQRLESCSKGGKVGGKIAGRKSVESGHLASLRTSEHQSKAGQLGGLIGGKIQGIRNVLSGHLSKISGLGGHIRWHAKRGISKLNCKFCLTERLKIDNIFESED